MKGLSEKVVNVWIFLSDFKILMGELTSIA